MSDHASPDQADVEELNRTVRYTVWAIYSRSGASAEVAGDGGLGA
jgi:hypothetical protein